MRGGTHFGDAGDALFGAFATTTTNTQQTQAQSAPVISGPRGKYRGWSGVFQGYVVDDFNDDVSIFTTEAAARDWADGK